MDNPYRRPYQTLDSIAQIARKILLNEGSHIPTVIVGGSQQAVSVQVEPFAPTQEERSYQLYLLGQALAQTREVGVLQQVFLISEGWMSMSVEGKPPQSPPSRDPERKEVLLVTQRIITPPQTRMKVFEMRQNSQGILDRVEDTQLGKTTEEAVAKSPLLEAFVIGYLGLLASTQD